ncbi:MAG: 4Fe-4S binding protein [Bacteroidales bacterium]|nr:4Fe-4S binding protein [Bacteroidales bacterium]
MRNGFIFNENYCVGCQACIAACVLENGWSFQPRCLYTFNSGAHPSLPLTNLSLACNHCEKPACLDGCPAGTFFRDSDTGAILIDEKKCIGCNYCKWKCPYDAPKYDYVKRVIVKCNLCYSGLTEGRIPACTSACPTGALGFGEIPEKVDNKNLSWFPDTNMNPAIKLQTNRRPVTLRIIPERSFDTVIVEEKDKKNIAGEWSLIGFSFLVTVSVAMLISSLMNGILTDKVLFLSLVISAGCLSLAHLGKIFRAWRAVTNIKRSLLSREIAIYLAYLFISAAALFSGYSLLILAASLTGLLLLIVIDNVYTSSDNRRIIILHSGQTFLTGLLIASFLSGMIYPFVFIAAIKLISTIYTITKNNVVTTPFWIRFFRIALLIIAGVSLLTGISYPEPVIIIIFLVGEFIDRILFYYDFNPLNINTLITEQINSAINEKKRD